MRALTIAESADIVLGLQDEIRRSEESRYDHRLHGVLLVAQGATCPQVGHWLGDSPRTVEYWVHRFESQGLAGLREGERPGRPTRLSDQQLKLVSAALRLPPRHFGLEGHLEPVPFSPFSPNCALAARPWARGPRLGEQVAGSHSGFAAFCRCFCTLRNIVQVTQKYLYLRFSL
jgi:hypothetical protein